MKLIIYINEVIKMNPRVSIIMGVHNLSDNYMKAINSIIEQTYKNWEFIICNDGSSDDTMNKLDKIAQKDNRIIIIENKNNKGLAYSLNKCIEVSKGEYIARMDDDDISKATRIQTEVDFLDANPQYAFVSTDYDIDNGHQIISKARTLVEEPSKYDFLWTSPFLHPATMFRKKALKSINNYRVAYETIRAEDYDLYIRLYANNFIGYNIPQKLFVYHVSDASMKKRKYKFRIYESIVRAKGFKLLKISFIKSVPYIIKPLIVGLIPKKILKKIQEG